MANVDTSTTKYNFTVSASVVDFGLNPSLDVDTRTLSGDVSPPRVRPQEHYDNIKTAWDSRDTSAAGRGYEADKWIGLMNQLGVSVGDIMYATGLSGADVREWLLSDCWWAPGDINTTDDMTRESRGVSSFDIIVAEVRGSPAGPYEVWYHSGYYLSFSSAPYVKFPTYAPYSSKSYTVSYHLKRFISGNFRQIGATKTFILNKSYLIDSPKTIAGHNIRGNVYFHNDPRLEPGSGVGYQTVLDIGNPNISSGGYPWKYQIVGNSQFLTHNTGDNVPISYSTTPPVFSYRLYTADLDQQIGEIRSSAITYGTYTPPTFGAGPGGGAVPIETGGASGASAPKPFVANVAENSKNLPKDIDVTSFIPVSASGGTQPFHYAISPALPDGLSYSSVTGAITGKPTKLTDPVPYVVTIKDALLLTATSTFTLAIVPATTAQVDLSGVTGELNTVKNLINAIPNYSTQLNLIQSYLENMKDYTTQLERIADALETIAANSDTSAEKLTTLATQTTAIAGHQNTIAGHQGTIATETTSIDSHQQKMRELAEGPGIRIISPYELLGLVSIYKILVEQGQALDLDEAVSPAQQEQALEAVKEYMEKLKPLGDDWGN